MLLGLSFGCEQCCRGLWKVKDLANRAWEPVSDSRLDVVRQAKSGFCDRLRFIKVCRLLTSKWAELESKMAIVGRLSEQRCVYEKDLEMLWAAHVCVDDKLTGTCLSMTAVTTKAKAESDTWAARVAELKVYRATCNEELGVVVCAVRSLKGFVAA